jgi:hypothetical protein
MIVEDFTSQRAKGLFASVVCLIEEKQLFLQNFLGLFWVAFLIWGLWCLQVASGKVTGRHRKS